MHRQVHCDCLRSVRLSAGRVRDPPLPLPLAMPLPLPLRIDIRMKKQKASSDRNAGQAVQTIAFEIDPQPRSKGIYRQRNPDKLRHIVG